MPRLYDEKSTGIIGLSEQIFLSHKRIPDYIRGSLGANSAPALKWCKQL